MKKLIVLWVVLICSTFISLSTFAIPLKQKRRSHTMSCEECNEQFTRAESHVRHILNSHYACPWCNGLKYLKKGDFNNISSQDRQARLNHIKKCAELQKHSSLWICKKCFAFQRRDNLHKCGEDCHVNLILDDTFNFDVMFNLEEEVICNKCSNPKKKLSIQAFKNHMIRGHGICPCCSFEFTKKNKPLSNLTLQDRQTFVEHLIQCTQVYNESLFVCDTCFSVELGYHPGKHIKRSCSGLFVKKIYTAQEVELFPLNEDLELLSEIVQEHEKSVLSRLQDEDDNSGKSEKCLLGDFFTEADFELNGFIEDTSNGVVCNKSNNFQRETTCNKCPNQKEYRSILAFKNHMLREHGMCPCCSLQITDNDKSLKNLSLQELEASIDHLVQCTQGHNEKLFVCDTCFGVKLRNKTCTHFKKLCKGLVTEKTYIAHEAELSLLNEDLGLLSEIVQEHEKPVLSRLQDEDDNSGKSEDCLVADFFTGADFELNRSIEIDMNNKCGSRPKKNVSTRLLSILRCESCNKQFTRAESHVRHILNSHYACPWCNGLKYLKKGDFKNISSQDRQARLNHIKKCAELQKHSSLWVCKKCFAFQRRDNLHKCGEDCHVNLILNLEEKTICNKCPNQKKHRSIRSFKNHMLREHGACPGCSFQITNENKSLKDLNLQERQVSLDHLAQCIQLKNESLFVCDTCFGVKLGNNAGTHFKRSCKGLISEKTYIAHEAELLALNPELLSLNQNLDEQLQELLNSSIENTSFLPENNSTHCLINTKDQSLLEYFFQIIDNNSVESECYSIGDTNFKSDFILDSAVCPSLYSQMNTQSCGVSGHLSTS